MITKLFAGLAVSAALLAAGLVGQTTSVTDAAACCKSGTSCCTKDCCKDCPNCKCECACCKDCSNGCECPNKS